jgi:hypothetical protein
MVRLRLKPNGIVVERYRVVAQDDHRTVYDGGAARGWHRNLCRILRVAFAKQVAESIGQVISFRLEYVAHQEVEAYV